MPSAPAEAHDAAMTINRKLMLSRRIAATAGAAIVSGLFALPAHAAEPANQACLGDSLSALASEQPVPGAFGHGVVAFAQAPDAQAGLGNGIQALQAGFVPDEVVPNTCND
jgi:hypothetical protein